MLDTRSRYDAISPWYDLLTGFGEGRARRLGLELIKVEDGDTILEIGCGTGQSLLPLARSVGERGFVYGIDLSSGMLARAHARLAQHGPTHRVRLLAGDARCLPFASDRFDFIWISFTLELLSPEEILQCLSECQRVLVTGGRLCVVALARRAESSAMSELYDWLHAKFPQWIDCRPISIQAFLTQAGFNLEKVKELSLWGLPLEIVLAYHPEKAACPPLVEIRTEV